MNLIPPDRPERPFRLNRRAAIAGLTALAVSGGHLRTTVAQGTPAATPSGESDAVQLLNAAAAAMGELETFAFKVITIRGETTILEGFTLDQIAGVVRRPSDFETTVTVEIPFGSIELMAVSVGGEVWIELPAFGDMGGGWQPLGSSDSLLSLLNPDALILRAVPFIDNATISGTGEVNGADVTSVTGTVDFQAIADRVVGENASLSSQIADGPVQLTLAIDDSQRVREIEIAGPLLASEPADVIRLVTFSEFNEPVDIAQPDVSG